MNQIANTFHELDTVSLTRDLPEHALKQGDKGAIVHCYPNNAAFEVEFVDPEGHTLALMTLTRSDIQPSPIPSTPSAHV